MAKSVKIADKNIVELCDMSIVDIIKFFESIYKNGDEVVIIGNKARSYFKKDIKRSCF